MHVSISDKIDDLKGKVEEKAEELKDKAEEGIAKGKEKLYKAAATVSDHIEKKEGRIGKAAAALDEIGAATRRFMSSHEAKKGAEAVKKGLKAAKDKSASLYDRFRQEVIKEGYLDIESVEKLLKKGAEATEEFGTKAIQSLSDIVKKTHAGIKADYRSIIPSKEEIAEKYTGIGTNYQGVMLRKNFEGCLSFYEASKKKLPSHLKTRADVLSSIKAGAVSDKTELGHYCERRYYEVRKSKGEESPEANFAYKLWNDAAKYLILK
jgi:hypothetical protein